MDERWSPNNEGAWLAATVSAVLSASLTALLQIHAFLPTISFIVFFAFHLYKIGLTSVNLCEYIPRINIRYHLIVM